MESLAPELLSFAAQAAAASSASPFLSRVGRGAARAADSAANRSMQPDSLTTSPERAMQVEHCDLLVAGSGAGGLSTAVVAAHLGLKVIVVEKDSQFGGTTAWSGLDVGCHAIHWLSRRVLSKASTRHSTTCATSSVMDANEPLVRTFLENAPHMVTFFRTDGAAVH